MRTRARWSALMAAFVATAATSGARSLLAQETTGKIEGTVRDDSGEPLASAQVLIVGSALRAVTDEGGYYFLNRVPAGIVIVRAQYIGYAPNEVRGVRVLADQTMTVDPVLERRAIVIEGITVTVAQNPIVPRDQVTTKPTVEGEAVRHLPVDAVGEVLRLQPGVVESDRGLSIRGSRPGTQATYVDGVLVRNLQGAFGTGTALASSSEPASTATTATVGTNALEEASVTTGAPGAAYAQAMGGVVALVTRAGGTTYHGSLSYATDELAGQVHGAGLNRVEASFGGPIAPHFTFYLASTLQGQQNPPRPSSQQYYPYFVLNGVADSVMMPLSPYLADGATPNKLSDSALVRVPRFVQYAAGCSYQPAPAHYKVDGAGDPVTLSPAEQGSCRSTRLPNANSDQTTFDGKLQYTFGTDSRAALVYHFDRNQALGGATAYDPLAQPGRRATSQALIAHWSQNLARSAEHSLALEAALSWQRDRFIGGLVRPDWMAKHTNPFAWFNVSNIQFVTDFNSFPIDDQLIQRLRLGQCLTPRAGGIGACVPYLNRTDLLLRSAYRVNPYGVAASAYPSDGLAGAMGDIHIGAILEQESRLVGRVNVDWQANRTNRIQAGFDFTNAHDLAWSGDLIEATGLAAQIAEPRTFGAFAQDRLDLGDLVVEVGLRYDRMSTGILYPRAIGRVFTDPLRSNTLTLDEKLAISYNAQDSAMARACDAALAAADSTALATCNFFPDTPRHALSPSLRVSFPVTDHTAFRLSYAHQVQTPDISLAARRTNGDESIAGGWYSRPLDFARTVLFEFGIRHAFSQDMVLDISAYTKAMYSEVTGRTIRIYDPYIGGPPDQSNASVAVYSNANFGNVRGFDLRLERRVGALFRGTIAYTFQTAVSTSSDPLQWVYTYGADRANPPEALVTTSDNRTHTIAGNVAATFPAGWRRGTLLGSVLQNAGIFATFRFASGLPYTLLQNGGLGVLGPGNALALVWGIGTLEEVNSSTMPWIKDVSLRLTKDLRVTRRPVTVFADFHNLFNWRNLRYIFAETGDVVNQMYQERTILPQYSVLQSDAGVLWAKRSVTVNGVAQLQTGVDLSDCSRYPIGRDGSRGAPDCLLLRQAEARWGNGDNFFDTQEQTAAFNAWYEQAQGPQTFYAPGLSVRLGFELNF